MFQSQSGFTPEELTIVIPFHAATAALESCLCALFSIDSLKGPIVLVADGTAEHPSERWLKDNRVSLIVSKKQRGPAAARNSGAKSSKTRYILFLDSDVLLPKNTFECLKNFYDLGNHAGISLFAARPPISTVCGRYKNSYMRFSYQNIDKSGNVPAFLTSAATCSRQLFSEIGGFDENYKRPSIEDADFGYRLRQKGKKIKIIPSFEINHIHEYTTRELLLTGFLRAAAVTRLSLRLPKLTDTENERTSPSGFRLSLISALLLFLSLVFSGIIFTWLLLFMAFIFYCIIILLNRKFLMTIQKEWGISTATFAMLLLPLDGCSHAFGILWGIISYLGGHKY